MKKLINILDVVLIASLSVFAGIFFAERYLGMAFYTLILGSIYITIKIWDLRNEN